MSVRELMTNLADSVRLKTGRADKMTLEQIAAAIMGITVEGELSFTCGTLMATATGSPKTIEHGLGQVPGALIFLKKGNADTIISGTSTMFYDALLSIVFGAEAGHVYCYHMYRKGSTTPPTSSSTSNRMWSFSSSIPDSMFGKGMATHSYYATNINETSFTTPYRLVSGRDYFWIAFRAPLV